MAVIIKKAFIRATFPEFISLFFNHCGMGTPFFEFNWGEEQSTTLLLVSMVLLIKIMQSA